MSREKAIKSGEERRKPYRKAKAVSKSCRNHGGCPHCESNRKHNDAVRRQAAEEQIREHKRKPKA